METIEHSKPTIGEKEVKAVLDVMRTGLLFEGDVVRTFETKLSGYIGSAGGVATSTGTLALYLALLCLGVTEEDEVIVPSYTCRSVLNSILYSRAKPVLCDVNERDYNISFKAAQKAITRKTKVIVVPHMFGYAAEIEKFRSLGIYIIEDCAHLVGAEHQGKKLGSFGDLSIFSFEGTKYIVAGEGGMVLANDPRLLSKLRKLKEPNSFDYKLKHTYRMTNLQAAVGCAQLSQVETFINKRRRIATIYNDRFSDLGIELPEERRQSVHVFHRYMVKVKSNIRALMEECYEGGVKVKQPVKPWPLHKYLGLPGKSFPNTEHIMRSAISIPIYPSLSDKQIEHIVKIVKHATLKTR